MEEKRFENFTSGITYNNALSIGIDIIFARGFPKGIITKTQALESLKDLLDMLTEVLAGLSYSPVIGAWANHVETIEKDLSVLLTTNLTVNGLINGRVKKV